MLIPKANRKAIYKQLFQEGVLVAEKDFNAPKHMELEDLPNLQVIKACQSLKSRGLVKEQFAWRHYYWFLTDEGIDYIREYLHLPADVVPNTLHRKERVATGARPGGDRPERPRGGDRAGFRGEGRSDYRRAGGEKPTGGAPGGFEPQFRGGFASAEGGAGRGRGQ